MTFIETPRFPDDISYGSNGGPGYDTSITVMAGGHEKRNVNWPTPRHSFNAAFGVRDKTQLATLIAYFHSMAGMGHAFRYKDHSDYSSAGVMRVAISNTDQSLGDGDGSTRAFQLRKQYITGALTRNRSITKPVVGSTVVSIGDVGSSLYWTVDTTTGIVTFDTDLTSSGITGITKASPAVVTEAGHNVVDGSTHHISNVAGMVELNGGRFVATYIDANSYSLAVDTTLFTTYTSGGERHTLPQTGETVKAGFEFDVPCRFNTDTLSTVLDNYVTESTAVPVIEIRI